MPISEVTVAERRNLRAPYAASQAVTVGDLMYWDSANKVARPANTRTDTGSKAGNQADFAPIFLGVSADQRLAAETAVTGSTSPTGPGDRVVVGEGIFDCPCASATFEFGDLVGIDRDGTGSVNLNQQVVGVSSPNLAIGFVLKREPAAVTKVRCFLSTYKYGWFEGRDGLDVFGTVATAAGGYASPALAIGAAALGLYWGSGAPTVSAPKGSLYLRTDGSSTSTRLYVNTDGGTTWTNVTTAA